MFTRVRPGTKKMDSLLRQLEELPNTQPIAYADNLVILIPENNRRALEKRGAAAIAILESWASSNKLTVSERKTVGTLLNGALHYHRPPTIPTAGGNLRFQECVRYLKVILQEDVKIDHHVTETANKAKRLSCPRPTWRTGMGIPGSKLRHPVQGALPEHLCIRSAWLDEKTRATSPETTASGTEAGVDQNDEKLTPRPPPTVCQLSQECSLLTCTYRGGYIDTGSVEDYQLPSEM
jgi:hypothetical protein